MLKTNLFDNYRIPANFCCDTCLSCEDTLLAFNNRIVYDASSGLTYFIPYKFNKTQSRDTIDLFLKLCDTCPKVRLAREQFVVHNTRRIHLKAGAPLVYIVRNVNPYLYDVELTDTAFLVNNEASGLLENLLFSKIDNPQGISPQSAGQKKEDVTDEQARYLFVKTALLHLRAEMGLLLENYRVMSRTAHNCIEDKKQKALLAIDSVLTAVGKDTHQSFTSFVDIFLDPISADSSLGKSLKALYGEFWRSKYVIAYRFPDIPEYDQINFKLAIKRKENAPYPDLLKSNYPTQIGYIRNFFKIDVSSGLYIGGLADNEFTTRKDSDLTVTPVVRGNRIIQENTGKVEFGFASYLHFYYKFGYFFNAGLHFGAGVNFSDKPRPRYFTGVSFLFGSNNRLCVNTGLMWGKVTELSGQYPKDANGNYKWLPEGESTLATRNRLKNGWSISVTYNLPFIKRKKASSDIEPPAAENSKTNTTNNANTTNTTNGADKGENPKRVVEMMKSLPHYRGGLKMKYYTLILYYSHKNENKRSNSITIA
ncbi:hypothetical protein [Paraflavitalea speifideaquila]|uniref:hypothetical protein n=1 Tax=Paraflavitalea speifideaquila TaxID=3076558 RepID=UPI0028EF462F|nr:hypothetical protein [Paraflavitalea speifideiaquila]